MVALGLSTALVGSSAPVPLYPLYRLSLGLDAFTMTVIFVVYVVAVLTALLIAGRLAPRLGNPHRLMVPAMGLVIAGALLMALFPSLPGLLSGRILAGLGTGMATVAANAALVELSPQRNVRHAALISTLSFGAGSAFGPILTGAMLQLELWPSVLPFLLVALTALAALIASARQMRETIPASGAAPVQQADAGTSVRLPDRIQWSAFALCAGTTLLTWSLGSSIMALGPYVGHQLLNISDFAIGGYASALFTLSGTTSQWLHRRTVPRPAFVRGSILISVGMATLCAAFLFTSPLTAAASLLLISIGYGGAFGAAAVLVNQLSPAAQRPRLVSWFYVAGYVGNLVPMLLGALTDSYGAMATSVGFSLCLALCMLGIGLRARKVFPAN